MKKLIVALTIVAFMTGSVSYSVTPDAYRRRSGGGSMTMSPGYLNIDMQRTEAMKESVKPKDTSEEQIEKIDTDLQANISERGADKVKLDLKRKTGVGEVTPTRAMGMDMQTVIDSENYNVDIGSGDEDTKVYDEGGRLISEVIDDVRHTYVGFDNVGTSTIAQAISHIDARGGGIVIIKEGRYSAFTTRNAKNDMRLFGGYNEYGERDIENSRTLVVGQMTVQSTLNNSTIEINGFAIESYGTDNGFLVYDSSFIVANCDVKFAWYGILAYNSDFSVINTKFTRTDFNAIIMYNSSARLQGCYIRGEWTSRTSISGYTNSTLEMSDDNDLDRRIYGVTPTALAEPIGPEGFRPPETITPDLGPPTLSQNPNRSFYRKSLREAFNPTLTLRSETLVNKDKVIGIFKGLLINKDALMPNMEGTLDPALIAKLLEESLRESVLVLPLDKLTPQEINLAMMLANILTNPTAEQKVMIDTLVSLMNETQKLEKETGSKELKQASDDFTQMVATVLLAQALPDLFKEGEIANIKNIFGNLDTENSKILLEYHAQAKSYYENIIKELTANMTALQIKDLLAKDLSRGELEKLPADRIDEILGKIRTAKNKTITEETILKQEARYREEYLTPAQKILEENMKTLLQGFTEKLFVVLDEARLVKEKVLEGKPTLNIDLSAK